MSIIEPTPPVNRPDHQAGASHSITRWLGKVWENISYVSSYLSELMSDIFHRVFNFSSNTPSPPRLLNVTVIEPDSTKPIPTPLQTASKKEERPVPAKEIEPIQMKQDAGIISYSQVQNVPDDGNCLFYAIGVGLKKRYPEQTGSWSVSPEDLVGDLSHNKELLKPIGELLRQNAANYLMRYLDREEIQMALMGAMLTHNEKIEQNIRETQENIEAEKLLNEDLQKLNDQIANDQKLIDQLKKEGNTSLPNLKPLKDLIHRNEAKVEQINRSYEENKAANIQQLRNQSAEDIESYIQLSRSDAFYCDSSHIFALSQQYQVPIVVWSRFQQSAEAPRTETVGDKEFSVKTIETSPGKKIAYQPLIYGAEFANSYTPAIEIIHVNGNHYMHLSS